MDRLEGRVAAILEGGGETGQAVARQLAKAGATVVLIDSDADAADRAAGEIRQSWGTAAVQVVDKLDPQTAENAIATINRTCDGIDILVLQQADLAGEDHLIDAALPTMQARGHGVLVLVDARSNPHEDLATIEERLSACRKRLAHQKAHAVLTYAVAPLEPGRGNLGSAIAYLAAERPHNEFAGRLIVVPPD